MTRHECSPITPRGCAYGLQCKHVRSRSNWPPHRRPFYCYHDMPSQRLARLAAAHMQRCQRRLFTIFVDKHTTSFPSTPFDSSNAEQRRRSSLAEHATRDEVSCRFFTTADAADKHDVDARPSGAPPPPASFAYLTPSLTLRCRRWSIHGRTSNTPIVEWPQRYEKQRERKWRCFSRRGSDAPITGLRPGARFTDRALY